MLSPWGARGFINAMGNLGGFCGPYAVGVLISLYSKDAGVYCLAISLAIAAFLALALPEDSNKTTQQKRVAHDLDDAVSLAK